MKFDFVLTMENITGTHLKMPRPDEVQYRLMGSTTFSTFDLKSGYWQLPVHPDDQPKTAFCPGAVFGLFEFCRMPFGFCSAPTSFFIPETYA